jgi:putative nucleotidyltransferase with HDIG domain
VTPSLAVRLDRRLAAGGLDLPFPPAATGRILELCGRDDVDMSVLAGVVASDPTLAAHFLRLSNTAVFAARAPILSLHHAVTRLGTRMVRQVVLLITCHARAFHVRGREPMAREMLEHAVMTAVFAQEVARARGESTDEAFMCGLLHDIGSPAVLQLISDLETEANVRYDDEIVAQNITRLHEGVGFQIASQWSTSPTVCESIGSHHRVLSPYDRSPTALAVATLQLAEAMAEGVGTEVLFLHPAVSLLGLHVEDVEGLEKARKAATELADNLR